VLVFIPLTIFLSSLSLNFEYSEGSESESFIKWMRPQCTPFPSFRFRPSLLLKFSVRLFCNVETMGNPNNKVNKMPNNSFFSYLMAETEEDKSFHQLIGDDEMEIRQ
jgi:hypothetical protein